MEGNAWTISSLSSCLQFPFLVPTTPLGLKHIYLDTERASKQGTRKKKRTRTRRREMGFFLIQRFICLPKFPLLFLLISQSFASETISLENKKTTVYDVLKDFNFPIGILPKGVLDYDLDSSSGKFSAFLNGSCSFSLEGSYQLKYKNTIKGYLSKGKLASLEGVSVKLLFMWVNIVEVSRRGDDLEFSVGIAGAGFPIDNFEECPQCGCGVNCNNQQVRKVKKNPFVSSY